MIEDNKHTETLDYTGRVYDQLTSLEINAVLDLENDGEVVDILFGLGADRLENKCVLNVSDGTIDMGDNDDKLITNKYITTNELKGGRGFDQLFLSDVTCDDVTGAKNAKPMLIDGFEKITIKGDLWQLQGDYSDSKIRLGSGENSSAVLTLPLEEKSTFGLRTKQFKYDSGIINPVLDLADISFPTKGRWRVIDGLSRSTFKEIKNSGAINLDLENPDMELIPDWRFRGSKLILRLNEA